MSVYRIKTKRGNNWHLIAPTIVKAVKEYCKNWKASEETIVNIEVILYTDKNGNINT